jgi:hypothetical protein
MRGFLPCPPVSDLVLLLSFEVYVSLKKICQTCAGISERSSCMVSIKQTNDVQSEISLKPYDVHIRAVQDFQDMRVGKYNVERLQLPSPWFQCIDYPVLVAGAYLHQRYDSDVRTVVVMLKVNGDLFSLLQLLHHCVEGFGCVDKCGCGGFERWILFGLGVFIYSRRVLVGFDLRLIRMGVSARPLAFV